MPAAHPTPPGGPRRRLLLAVLALVGMLVAACGSSDTADGAGGAGSPQALTGEPTGRLRLGYFPNVTHAPAIVGLERGAFTDALGAGVDLQARTFNSGTEAVEALFSGAVDAAFVGPNPAINGYAQSGGEALRIVAGTTSGGAALVVRDGIEVPGDLIGTVLATPGLGNSQDVALRSWLAGQGLDATTEGGGDVSVRPQENADTLTAFVDGAIDGAWVPEPWATRLVLEGGGHVLVDEAALWAGGRFVTTQLVVAASYLRDHPAIVRALIAGLLDSIDAVNADPAAASTATNDGIEAVTGKRLADATLAGAWRTLTFTPDPVPASLEGSKAHAVAVDLLEPVDLGGIYDLALLNQELADRGQPPVAGFGG
ncbi:MAG: ABC transporter substrate-binding protein [Acidimicrobiales bacterium]